MSSFKIKGLEGVLAKLEGLSDETRRKGGRYALRKAAQVVRDAARENANRIDDPATQESISKNIVERWDGRFNKRTGDLRFRVGVLGGAQQYADTKANRRKGRSGQAYVTGGDKQNPGGDTWYWRLVEFGTSKTRAQPFMRPALTENIETATEAFIGAYGKAIDRALKRIRRGRV